MLWTLCKQLSFLVHAVRDAVGSPRVASYPYSVRQETLIHEASAEKLLLDPAELPPELETGLGLGIRLEFILSARWEQQGAEREGPVTLGTLSCSRISPHPSISYLPLSLPSYSNTYRFTEAQTRMWRRDISGHPAQVPTDTVPLFISLLSPSLCYIVRSAQGHPQKGTRLSALLGS